MTSRGTVHLALAVKMGFGLTLEIRLEPVWALWCGFLLCTASWQFRYWLITKSYQTVSQCSMVRFVLLHLLVTQKRPLLILARSLKKQFQEKNYFEGESPRMPCAAIVKRINLHFLIIVESAIDASVAWTITVHGWTIVLEPIISSTLFFSSVIHGLVVHLRWSFLHWITSFATTNSVLLMLSWYSSSEWWP